LDWQIWIDIIFYFIMMLLEYNEKIDEKEGKKKIQLCL